LTAHARLPDHAGADLDPNQVPLRWLSPPGPQFSTTAQEAKMRHMMWTTTAVVVGVLICSAAGRAQTPATPPAPPSAGGTPDAMPFDIPYGVSIGLERAKVLMAAAEAEAKKRNWKLNIAIADTNGELVHFSRMEGAQIGSVTVSQGKARTAARYRRETRVFYNAFETGHGYVATLDPTLVASPGGFPLVENGKLIGGIGCSGGTGDQDAVVCKAGADALK
jgi:uncharacterized protein GlcG (DUF336 family)